uniref:Chitin-binding type-2 domain-containing protein n=1 Tax=Anopheles coluzzii TaxID=1518534 RepID=A0A8W7Q2C8_ANOCL
MLVATYWKGTGIHTSKALVDRHSGRYEPKVTRGRCPAGTLFDAYRKMCVERDVAICGTVGMPNPPLVPSVPIQPPSLPIVPPSQPIMPPSLPIVPPVPMPMPQPQPPSNLNSLQMLCRGKPLGAKIRNPSNCSEYVNCIGTTILRFTRCPIGTSFDDVRKICDWVQNVQYDNI